MPIPQIAALGRRPLGTIGALLVLAWLMVAFCAPFLAPHDPLALGATPLQPPTGSHPFGTDQLGRDVLSRVVWGARLSVPLAVALNVLALAVGATLGGVAGFFGGRIEGFIMRLTDLFFAFPTIILAMAVTAALGPSIQNAVLAIVVVFWPVYARLTRGMVKSIVTSEYVVASRLLGTSSLRVLRVDIAPNVAGPIVVMATLQIGDAVLLLAALSFLGLGAQPPAPEWGAMISIATQYVSDWWLALFPGLAMLSVVFAFNLIGDSARDVLDKASK